MAAVVLVSSVSRCSGPWRCLCLLLRWLGWKREKAVCGMRRVALNFELSFDLNSIFLGFDIQKLWLLVQSLSGGGGLRFALGRYPVRSVRFRHQILSRDVL